MIAALYIDPRGLYPTLSGVDAYGLQLNGWGQLCDANKYQGPWPVVAHPPCGGFSSLKHLAHARDVESATRAFASVREFGGVLEQPAGSAMFALMGAPRPGEPSCGCYDRRVPEHSCECSVAGGYTIELDQCEWGHVARKRTWLYLVGVPHSALEDPPFPGRKPTHWVSGGRKHPRKGSGGFAPPGIKICSAQQRNRTPVLFAEYLVRLARTASKAARIAR